MTQSSPRTGAMGVLLLTVFIDMVGFGIIIPFLPFWAERFEATPDVVTLLMTTYAACQFVFAFFWGWLSDRWGRKPILLVSLLGSVLSFLILAFAQSLLTLFVARAVAGSMGGSISVAHAYVADVTEEADRARGIGLLGAASGLGFILGPAIGGFLAGPDPASPDFQAPFLSGAGISFVALLLGLVFLREPQRHRAPLVPRGMIERFRAFGAVLGHPAVAASIVVITLTAFVMGGLEAVWVLWTERKFGWGPRENAWFFTYIGALLVLVQGWLVGRLTPRFGESRIAPVALLIMGVGIGGVPLSNSLPMLFLTGGLIAVGVGMANPVLNSLTSRNAPADRQGAVLGASQSSQSLARVFGPAVAGLLFAAFGKDTPFIAGGILLLFAAALTFRISAMARARG